MMDHNKWMNMGGFVYSSGTTGPAKRVYQPPEKLVAANRVALESQCITADSRVLTVCRMSHAGGALAQTLPALCIGADVRIEKFNPYTFLDRVKKFTHTHLTPDHCRAIMGTKGWRRAELDGLWVTCGSDAITWDMVEQFVERGATFMTNWGMSECGPIAINSTYTDLDKVKQHKEMTPEDCTIMGDTHYFSTGVKINPDESFMLVAGDITSEGKEKVYLHTNDVVTLVEGVYYYRGRYNTKSS